MTVQEVCECHGNDGRTMSSCGPRAMMTSTRCSRSIFIISGMASMRSRSYEIEAPQLDDIKRRRKNMQKHRLPHLVADLAGTVVGYAYAVPFRKRPAYRYVVKHSIYVHHEHLHSGIGRLLLPALIDACAASGYRQMIGYIDASNNAVDSIARSLRFSAGRLSTVDRLQIRSLDGRRDDAAFARAWRHDQAGHVAVIAVTCE